MKIQINKVIVALLAINLIMILSLSIRLNAVIIQVDKNIDSAYLMKREFDELQYIKRKVNDISDKLEYISNIDIAIIPKDEASQIIKFNWQIKDYDVDSNVTLFYKMMNEDFVEIPAVHKKQSCFEAEAEIQLQQQPIWRIDYESRYDSRDDFFELNSDHKCEYYISIDEGDRIISSEIDNVHLSDLMTSYGTIVADVTLKNNKPDHICLDWMTTGKRTVKGIFAKLYSEKTLLKEMDLMHEKQWYGKDIPNLDYDTIKLFVKYEDGKVFEREIWGKSVVKPLV